MAKRLSCLITGHQSVPGGLEWLPSSSPKALNTHWPGEDDNRPASFFPTGLVEPKCWYLKNGGVGWKHGGASLQVAHHNLNWHLHFPNNIGIVWEAGGNGEARVFSIADVAGYNSIPCLSLHIAAAAQHRFTSFFQKFQTKRHWNHLVLKMEILIDQNQGC